MAKSKITVAKYLEQQLAVCGKTQREIATEVGYANANILTMFKNGLTKIPVTKVGALAKALGVDQAFLLRLVVNEYMPETWTAIEEILGGDNLLTDQEKSVAMFVRKTIGDTPIDLSIDENRKTLAEALKSIAARDQSKAAASVKRLASLSANSPLRN